MTSHTPSAIQVWLLAARPRTLPAAISPVLVGTAVAFYAQAFQLAPALTTLFAAVLLQIGANLANDVFDFKRGADTQARLGPPRVTQLGLLKPDQVMIGMGIVFSVAALLGLYLVWVGGWPIIIVGLLSILFAIGYSAGPFPLAYLGLGDLFAFLFFGLVAVCGTHFLQAGNVTALALWSGLPVGFMVTAILVVNNLRDVDTDRAAGKHTLAVRLGAPAARSEYLTLLILAYAVPAVMLLFGVGSAWLILTWLSLPLAYRWLRLVLSEQGRILNQALAGTAQLTLVYAILFALGLIIARLTG